MKIKKQTRRTFLALITSALGSIPIVRKLLPKKISPELPPASPPKLPVSIFLASEDGELYATKISGDILTEEGRDLTSGKTERYIRSVFTIGSLANPIPYGDDRKEFRRVKNNQS